MTNNVIPGGYTAFRALNDDDKELFKTVMKPLVGVDYQPVAVATQVVAGVNYKFFCNAMVVRPESPTYTAMVTIFQPLPNHGDPYITAIQRVD